VFAFVTSFWCVFRLRMLTEHLGTPTTHCVSPAWWQRAIFLPHGTWLHDVHHVNQNVPCHRLEEALAFYPGLAARKTVGALLGELTRGKSASSGEPLPGPGRAGVEPSRRSTALSRQV
jgi:fatty acid desaturase